MDRKLERVRRVIYANGKRIVLFSWGAAREPRLRNVAALRSDGSVEWLAALPEGTGHDCFVKLETLGQSVFATTFSGLQLRLCPATGAHLA